MSLETHSLALLHSFALPYGQRPYQNSKTLLSKLLCKVLCTMQKLQLHSVWLLYQKVFPLLLRYVLVWAQEGWRSGTLLFASFHLLKRLDVSCIARCSLVSIISPNIIHTDKIGTSVICTDKTGTLTTNEMTAVSLVLLENTKVEEHTISGVSYSPSGVIDGIEHTLEIKNNPNGSVADVAAVSALCNDANIIGSDEPKASSKPYERLGEPTEAALCVLAEKLGGKSSDSEITTAQIMASANVNSWRSDHPRQATLEFNRDRKSMSVLSSGWTKANARGNRLLVKGAPNLLLERCTHAKLRDGTVMKLDGKLRRQIEEKTTDLATRPLRVLALAIKETDKLEESLMHYSHDVYNDDERHPLLSNPDNYASIESGLTWVGMVGIKDPARPEVADSINKCHDAGIRVIMITGDARDTAVAIARDVNILPPASSGTQVKAYEGREFFEKTESEQMQLLASPGNMIFCRAEPSDKQLLIKMLQSMGEIVAMTGDGVNDAPA